MRHDVRIPERRGVDIVEAALRLDAPRKALECLAVEVYFAGAALFFPAADRARLRSLLRQLRSSRDGHRNLPAHRASSLAAAIVGLDPDCATWRGRRIPAGPLPCSRLSKPTSPREP